MDQEVSRITWTGVSLLALVGAISLAIVIFGLSRTFAIGEINSLSKKLTDDNVKELSELNGATVDLTDSAIMSILDRNNKAIKDTMIVVKTPTGTDAFVVAGGLDASKEVKTKLGTYGPGLLSYTTIFKRNIDGTMSLVVYTY